MRSFKDYINEKKYASFEKFLKDMKPGSYYEVYRKFRSKEYPGAPLQFLPLSC